MGEVWAVLAGLEKGVGVMKGRRLERTGTGVVGDMAVWGGCTVTRDTCGLAMTADTCGFGATGEGSSWDFKG